MKKLMIALLLVTGSLTMHAQDANDAGKGQVWYSDVKAAMKVSKKKNKPLLLFFTGSDWCGWCIRLQKEVFKTPEFTKWAKDNVVLVELDFPRKKQLPAELQKQNMELQQTFQVRGYPTVWIVKATTNKDKQVNFEQLGTTGYVAGGPSKWLEGANQILANNKKKKS